jgi:hypothetical protein
MTLSRRQLPFQDCLTQCTRLVYLPRTRDPGSRGSASQKDQWLNGAYIAWRHAFPGRWRLLWREIGPAKQVRSLPAVDSSDFAISSDFASFRRRMSKMLVALKLRYALVKPGCGVRLNLRRMDRFISMTISRVRAGPFGTSRITTGCAMPILIWIATIACMFEITMGPPGRPDQSNSDLQDRSRVKPPRKSAP